MTLANAFILAKKDSSGGNYISDDQLNHIIYPNLDAGDVLEYNFISSIAGVIYFSNPTNWNVVEMVIATEYFVFKMFMLGVLGISLPMLSRFQR